MAVVAERTVVVDTITDWAGQTICRGDTILWSSNTSSINYGEILDFDEKKYAGGKTRQRVKVKVLNSGFKWIKVGKEMWIIEGLHYVAFSSITRFKVDIDG